MIASSTLEAFLAELSSSAPTPGGGASVLLTLAQGFALWSMALTLSHRDTSSEIQGHVPDRRLTVQAVLTELEHLRTQSLKMADEDIRIFESVMAALQMPRVTEEEKRLRSEVLLRELWRSFDFCGGVMVFAENGLKWGAFGIYNTKVDLMSDSAIATELILAGMRSSLWNVKANGRLILRLKADEHSKISGRLEQLDRCLAELSSTVQKYLDYCQSKLSF